MADSKVVEEIGSMLAAILAKNPKELLGKPHWGELNFLDAEGSLNDIQSMLKPLPSLPLRIIPQGEANAIRDTLSQITQILARIDNFRVNQDNAASTRSQIADELKRTVDQLYAHVSRHAAYLALQSGNLQKVTSDLVSQQQEISRLTDGARQYAESSQAEISKIMQTAREAAGNAGVGHFSTDFADHAEGQTKVARGWLLATGLLGLLTLIAASGSYFLPIPNDASSARIFQLAISKLVALGSLVSATVWCGRQYQALKHQITNNLHRANALKTFQAFVQAAADETAKDAVLMEATRSIFAITPSGYLGAHDAATPDALKIVEMVRGTATTPSQ